MRPSSLLHLSFLRGTIVSPSAFSTYVKLHAKLLSTRRCTVYFEKFLGTSCAVALCLSLPFLSLRNFPPPPSFPRPVLLPFSPPVPGSLFWGGLAIHLWLRFAVGTNLFPYMPEYFSPPRSERDGPCVFEVFFRFSQGPPYSRLARF